MYEQVFNQSKNPQSQLSFKTLLVGLNHIIRKISEKAKACRRITDYFRIFKYETDRKFFV